MITIIKPQSTYGQSNDDNAFILQWSTTIEAQSAYEIFYKLENNNDWLSAGEITSTANTYDLRNVYNLIAVDFTRIQYKVRLYYTTSVSSGTLNCYEESDIYTLIFTQPISGYLNVFDGSDVKKYPLFLNVNNTMPKLNIQTNSNILKTALVDENSSFSSNLKIKVGNEKKMIPFYTPDLSNGHLSRVIPTECTFDSSSVASHTWNIRSPIIEATCTESGISGIICNRCRTMKDEATINPLGHNWVSNNNGTHRCSRCMQTEDCYPFGEGLVCEKCGYTLVLTPLEITTSFINAMVVGYAINQTMQANKSDNITWSISSGSLPNGVSLNSNGKISGTPTAYGIFNVTIKATRKIHSIEQTATKSYSINVAAAMYTVTFNAMGGTTTITSKQVAAGGTIGELPEATMSGMNFGGWFTAATGGLKVSSDYTVSSNVTLYARYGATSDVNFGDATSSFNIGVYGDRTNFSNNPYTIYNRVHGTSTTASDLITQVGISSTNGSNMMDSSNKDVTLYLKVTNNGEARSFDIGFDADSYVVQNSYAPYANNDCVNIRRISNGLLFGADHPIYTLTCPYSDHTAWVGQYGNRTSNRYNNVSVGTESGTVDSGFAFTVNNVFINNGSYVILEFHFTIA